MKLKPYRHNSVTLRKNLKFFARYYGPYMIEERIGEVANRLRLLAWSKIHPIFHVKIGDRIVLMTALPFIDEERHIKVAPVAML